MRVFEKLQISKNANLRQIYAKRYQLTPIYVIVRKSPGVNLGKIGRCFRKNSSLYHSHGKGLFFFGMLKF